MSENTYAPPVVGDWPAPGSVRFVDPGETVPVFGAARTLPFAELRRERLIDDSVRACVDFSKVRLDKFGFLAVQGLDVEAIGAEFARRAAL